MHLNVLARRIFASACNAVEPKHLVEKHLKLIEDDTLYVNEKRITKLNGNVYVVAAGKAAMGMTCAVRNVLRGHLVRAIASVPMNTLNNSSFSKALLTDERIEIFEGARDNLPDAAAYETGKRIETMLAGLSRDHLLVVLLSGGGSALLTAPIEGISLDDKLTVIQSLASQGADIRKINIVRQHLSRMKGGRLARMARPARIVTLIISDIIGSPLDLIASGPTVEPGHTKSDALNILNEYRIANEQVMTVLLGEGRIEDKTAAEVEEVDDVENFLIGDNWTSLSAAAHFAETLQQTKTNATIVRCDLKGNATEIGRRFAQFVNSYRKSFFSLAKIPNQEIPLYQLLAEHKLLSDTEFSENWKKFQKNSNKSNGLICLLFGGETTVRVKGAGVGGRNQEMALAFLAQAVDDHLLDQQRVPPHLSKMAEEEEDLFDFCFLSAGTDGRDGPTDAAGACVDAAALRKILPIDNTPDKGQSTCPTNLVELRQMLDNNDSYNFWKNFDNGSYHLVPAGPTGTNVMDIQCLLLKRSAAK